MTLAITRATDGVTEINAAWWAARATEIETQVNLNETNIAALESYPGTAGGVLLADIQAIDGAGSGIDADTVDGYEASALIAAAGGFTDLDQPKRNHGVNVSAVEQAFTVAGDTCTAAWGMCLDSRNTLWLGGRYEGAETAQVRYYPDRDIAQGAGLDLGVSDYNVVNLVATSQGVFALLADKRVKVSGGSVFGYWDNVGKVAKIDVDTRALDTAWGSSGIVDLADTGASPNNCYDPWTICSDNTYLYIGCLMETGQTYSRLVRVTMSDGTVTSLTIPATTAPSVMGGCIVPYTLGPAASVRDYLWFGAHGRELFQTYSRLICVPRATFASPVYPPLDLGSGDDEEVMSIAQHSGVVAIALGASTDAQLKVAHVGDFTPGGPTLAYIDANYSSTITIARQVVFSPSGELYLLPEAGDENVVRFSPVGMGKHAIEEVLAMSLGDADYELYSALHDGRCLWIAGADTVDSEGFVLKVPI